MGATHRFLAVEDEASLVPGWFRSRSPTPMEHTVGGNFVFYFREFGPPSNDRKKSPLVSVFMPVRKHGVLLTCGEVHFLATPMSLFPRLRAMSREFRKWLSQFTRVFSCAKISSRNGITILKGAFGTVTPMCTLCRRLWRRYDKANTLWLTMIMIGGWKRFAKNLENVVFVELCESSSPNPPRPQSRCATAAWWCRAWEADRIERRAKLRKLEAAAAAVAPVGHAGDRRKWTRGSSNTLPLLLRGNPACRIGMTGCCSTTKNCVRSSLVLATCRLKFHPLKEIEALLGEQGVRYTPSAEYAWLDGIPGRCRYCGAETRSLGGGGAECPHGCFRLIT